VPVDAPPQSIVNFVESLAPGIYRDFVDRLLFGVAGQSGFVSSWWRSPQINREVGGAPESQHLLGLAVDVVVGRPGDAVVNLQNAGLVAVDEGTHVHLQRFTAGVVGPVVRFLNLSI